NSSNCSHIVSVGDSRNLGNIIDNSIDLIIFHPPYLNIIKYSNGEIPGDLSNISNVDTFFDEIEIIAKELFRVLKFGKFCTVLIGDTRKSQHYVPLSYFLYQRFVKSNFVLKEEIIKVQHNCTYSKRWESSSNKWGFYLIMHEHLFVFRKPNLNEDISKIKWSSKI
ncbi:MAG: site-specific DNA-methyltransferase, partial [Ignavibacteria bacterium]|nr:site-specific DNA-methyltransferase [Ignavibacteria bacterium]